MDFLTSILLGEDHLTQHPPTLQHPQTPPTSPTNPLEAVQDTEKVLGVVNHTPTNNPQQITNKPHSGQKCWGFVGNVGGTLEETPNIFMLSETVKTPFVGDVGGVWGLSGVGLELKQALEQHNPLTDAGWSTVWRERIQTHLQALEDWVWRDEYDLMRTANNGLPKARALAREKLVRWHLFMLEGGKAVSL